MKLSEDKAKKVLDFLAKKFGYDEFDLHDNQIGVIKNNGSRVIRSNIRAWIFPPNNWYDFAPTNSYVKCLKMLLAVAKKGYSITTYYDIKDFIKPFATLEELLVAYDLETGHTTPQNKLCIHEIDRRQSKRSLRLPR